MITRLAIAGYRSLRDLVVEVAPLTLVTGANGSGKSSLYRALRLLGEVAQGRLVASLAAEGGLTSALWAGPETIGSAVRRGDHPVQGTVRSGPVSLRLGFTGDDLGYAVDLGMPDPTHPFPNDPEIKVEAMWSGGTLGRANLFAERRGPMVKVRRADTGEWRTSLGTRTGFDSMVTHVADAADGLELLAMRDRMRDWRFYDALRTDAAAPARRPGLQTFTPVLASDGGDIAAAIETIAAIGDHRALADAVDDAFPGSTLSAGDGVAMRQHGLLRPLGAAELSDGTLRYLLLIAALLSSRPPELMVLNEPEASLHPALLPPLARLLCAAATRSQVIVVSHSDVLAAALGAEAARISLVKDFGETRASDADVPDWVWPKR